MCEMADIDGILTDNDPILIAFDKESDTSFNNRSVYWKTVNKYITGTIRYSLKAEGLSYIAGIFSAY